MKQKFRFIRSVSWPFKPPNNCLHNTKVWLGWLEKALHKLNPKANNALAVYMNQRNIDHLRKHVFPLDWLNYSPKLDDTLSDAEYLVDMEELVTPYAKGNP